MGSAGDPGGFERGVEVVVDHLERRCETVVDADLLRGELVLEHLIFDAVEGQRAGGIEAEGRSEEHTSELQSLMRISYAVFCLKKKQQSLQSPKTTIALYV